MIRPARPDESELLTALTRRSKAYWGYDDSFMRAHQGGLSISAEYLAAHITHVIDRRGEIAGFYALEHLDHERVELGYLFVEPAHIGRGLGRALMQHAVAVARGRGYRRIRIVSDPHADGFYRRMGAVPWGEWRSPIIAGRRLPVLQLDCVQHGVAGVRGAAAGRPDHDDGGKGDQVGRGHCHEALVGEPSDHEE
jgi:predicted N-acetyltransferase YhbS